MIPARVIVALMRFAPLFAVQVPSQPMSRDFFSAIQEAGSLGWKQATMLESGLLLTDSDAAKSGFVPDESVVKAHAFPYGID